MMKLLKEDFLKDELILLGRRLKRAREELGVKQKEMAAQLDISPSYISEIEKGKANPSFNFLLHLYRRYKVSLDWLLFEEGNMFCGIGIKDKGILPEFDYGDQTPVVIEMLDMMHKSPFFLNHMMSLYRKSKFEQNNIIIHELEDFNAAIREAKKS
jgi:XRE family transcriptional regulator, fatty acid utilization regulator